MGIQSINSAAVVAEPLVSASRTVCSLAFAKSHKSSQKSNHRACSIVLQVCNVLHGHYCDSYCEFHPKVASTETSTRACLWCVHPKVAPTETSTRACLWCVRH
mmetsp:Transcript_35946/g.57439  ORF Transcript_35946/g.57439 Transcript_35946/m.57439 type:complete len:103 (-) Transcript_35946:57-365(-)